MRTRRPLLALLCAVLVAPAAGAVLPGTAAADHTPAPQRVTLMGDLMSELGCGGDWDGDCTATDMTAGDGTWSLVADVPAGSYEFKVRLNGSWEENYGHDGAANGPNSPLVLSRPASLRFVYDHATHRTTVAAATPPPGLQPSDAALAGDSLREDLTRERFYFVMADRFENGSDANDTGGLSGGKLDHGFDPADKAFYHGGDLRGIIDRLDYLDGLGTTAIWMTPSFKNKPVQGTGEQASAGYHGYWITDFTQIDPHLGTNAELEQLIDLAHARGMKVFFDIITNHTADVLDYEDGAYAGEPGNQSVPYHSKAAHPYRDSSGNVFDDRDYAMGDTFPEVDESSLPYRPVFRSEADRTVKVPAWLNDPLMYHNRGTSTFAGEDAEYGDFPSGNRSALDDLWTERPEVVNGMIELYRTWVQGAGVDGFRIDTVKHVNLDFWKRFGPALQAHAADAGNDDFFMFGEVYDADPRVMSTYTTAGRLQATVDFGFQGTGVNFAKGRPTSQVRDFYASDDWYTDTDSNAYSAPTFLGNHDMGRVGMFLAEEGYGDAELLARDRLAHSLMYLTRGQPVVYYGDEQGFTGDGGDQAAREDMFPSAVASYNDNDLIGTEATTAGSNFDRSHPMYRHLSALSALREAHPALADGAQIHRYSSSAAGVYAFSRIDADEQVEYVVATNNATTAKTVELQTFNRKTMYRQLWPASKDRVLSRDDARITVTVPPLSAVVLRANDPLTADATSTPEPFLTAPHAGVVGGRAEIAAVVPGNELRQVTFAYRPVGESAWTALGTDDNAPYRVFHDVRDLPAGTLLEYRVVAKDADGDLGVDSLGAVVGTPPAPVVVGGSVTRVPQPGAVSVPGSHNSEMGCVDESGRPGDWQPWCEQAQLTLDPSDGIWKGTRTVPAGTYEYKVAINRSWDENYGLQALRNGSNIPYSVDGAGPVSFFYDHRTHWVNSTAQGPVLTAVGDFQSEVGCTAGDHQPTCMASWLQDPDGDGTSVFRTAEIPAGSYSVQVARDGVLTGEPASFTVPGDGYVTRFSHSVAGLEVSFEKPAPVPDLGTARAEWTQPDTIVLDVVDGADRRGWSYRLHYAPAGSLVLDQEGVGGTSLPLTLDPDSPADAERLLLSKKQAKDAAQIARSGQLAVVVYDASGRVVDATGVTVGGWAASAGKPGRR